MSMMTKERLAELRVRATNMLARNSGAWLYEPEWDVLLLIDAVEALQAELAEERAKRERAELERRYMQEDKHTETVNRFEAEDIANLAMRVGRDSARDMLTHALRIADEQRARASALEAERDDLRARAEKAERAVLEQSEIHRETITQGRLTMLATFKERDDLRAKLAACVAALESIQAIECEIDHDAIEVDCASLIARRAIAAAKGSP